MNCACLQGQTEDRQLVTFVCEKMPFRWLCGVKLGTAFAPAPSKARPVILDFLLNHFVPPKYNWNEMQRRVRCSVGWHNSPGLFLLALAGNLVQSRCHQWLRMFQGGGDKWYQEQVQRGGVYPFFSSVRNHFQGSSGVTGVSNTGKAVWAVKIPEFSCIGSFFPLQFLSAWMCLVYYIFQYSTGKKCGTVWRFQGFKNWKPTINFG